ncbi:MAG TPA: SycD/LcrH family type III secretion system chaperone [Chlamydiales bacterium]|nr:SycD/LcrH family type III secretion system chaperone [Chlamydiales bacterium]
MDDPQIPDDCKIPEEVLEALQKPDELRRHLDEGRSLQELIGYSDEFMQQLYNAAHDVFQEGRYQEAADGFLFLTTLNPYVYAYWLGLGMSQQLIEEYEQAIIAYECASKVEPASPIPDYYLAACHLLMNERDLAKISIEQAKQKCVGRVSFASLYEKILKAEQRITKKMSP